MSVCICVFRERNKKWKINDPRQLTAICRELSANLPTFVMPKSRAAVAIG